MRFVPTRCEGLDRIPFSSTSLLASSAKCIVVLNSLTIVRAEHDRGRTDSIFILNPLSVASANLTFNWFTISFSQLAVSVSDAVEPNDISKMLLASFLDIWSITLRQYDCDFLI